MSILAEREKLPWVAPVDENLRILRIAIQLQSMNDGKRSLLETRGHRFGRSCQHVQPGDKICLLYGGRLPFVLRKTGMVHLVASNDPAAEKQACQLIGGYCYMDILAYGEGPGNVAEGDPREGGFCLV
jgi:hypothetical protein